MKCDVLISTMNKENYLDLLKYMNINNNCTIINQMTKQQKNYQKEDKQKNIKYICCNDRGLSKSRNMAIKNSTGDICIIADDDMFYVNDYEKIIREAYIQNSDADIIAFIVDNENKNKRKKILKKGKIGFLKSMKLQSVQITLKKSSIEKNNIKFDEKFGAGSIYPWGEENIFLFDCLRKKLKIYYVPIKIATLYDTNESTWSRENNEKHFENQGVIYYRMSKKIYLLLILQFAVRKRKIYKKEMSFLSVITSMINGVRKYKKCKGDN